MAVLLDIWLFVCHRNPQVHCLEVAPYERFVVCPACGSGGEMVRCVMEGEA